MNSIRWSAGFIAAILALSAQNAMAQRPISNKLLLTGGVSQVEGAAGGGLTPWAVIGGYGTNNEIGANVFYTYANTGDFKLDAYGVAVGLYDRVELSVAEQKFDVSDLRAKVAAGLGADAIGRDRLSQTIVGIKYRVAGEAVLDQDTWMPQIAVGAQYKKNNDGDFIKGAVVGAKKDSGVDLYVSATKLFLDKSFLANSTVRLTKANQLGLLGFGSEAENSYRPYLELSGAYLLNRKLAVGAEYRMKPNQLTSPANAALFGGANVVDLREDDAFDVFVAYAPTKNVSLTAAYVHLGNIANVPAVGSDYGKQSGVYLSAQVGF